MGEHEIRRGGLVDHCLVREAAPRVLGRRHPLLRRIRDEVSGLGELLFRHLELDSAGLHGVDVSRFAARTFRCLRGGVGSAVGLRLLPVLRLRRRVVFGRVFGVFILVVIVFLSDGRILVIVLDGLVIQEVARVYHGHSRRRAETGAGEKDEVLPASVSNPGKSWVKPFLCGYMTRTCLCSTVRFHD